jgi:excisionase family DNA binding protein
MSSIMNTLDLEAAAKFLYASESTVLELVGTGELPAAKIGRKWVFVDIDLIEYIRSKYTPKTKGAKCHSTNEGKSGGYISPSTDRELDDLLTPVTKRRPKHSTTTLRLVSENEKSLAKPSPMHSKSG